MSGGAVARQLSRSAFSRPRQHAGLASWHVASSHPRTVSQLRMCRTCPRTCRPGGFHATMASYWYMYGDARMYWLQAPARVVGAALLPPPCQRGIPCTAGLPVRSIAGDHPWRSQPSATSDECALAMGPTSTHPALCRRMSTYFAQQSHRRLDLGKSHVIKRQLVGQVRGSHRLETRARRTLRQPRPPMERRLAKTPSGEQWDQGPGAAQRSRRRV